MLLSFHGIDSIYSILILPHKHYIYGDHLISYLEAIDRNFGSVYFTQNYKNGVNSFDLCAASEHRAVFSLLAEGSFQEGGSRQKTLKKLEAE